MLIDLGNFTPTLSFSGGVMIGAAAALLVLCNGRIAGISGIVGGLFARPRKDVAWRAAFLAGLVGAPLLAALSGHAVHPDIESSWGEVLLAGLLVGLGTRFASGCTSGHGVCGIARGSIRSLVATLTFMAAGFATVFVTRHLLGA